MDEPQQGRTLHTEGTVRDTPNDPLAGAAWRIALGIGALYALFGVVWIMVSDALVLWASADPAWVAAAQRVKGIVYVAATALALILLVLSLIHI